MSTLINDEFLKFLSDTPSVLKKMLDIAYEFYKIQGESPVITGSDGPKEWKSGETYELTTIGLSHDDLDAIAKGYAEAIVKEKAIEYIKGFIQGVLLVK